MIKQPLPLLTFINRGVLRDLIYSCNIPIFVPRLCIPDSLLLSVTSSLTISDIPWPIKSSPLGREPVVLWRKLIPLSKYYITYRKYSLLCKVYLPNNCKCIIWNNYLIWFFWIYVKFYTSNTCVALYAVSSDWSIFAIRACLIIKYLAIS